MKNVTENNKLIAEFMGYINTTPTDKDFNIYENKNGDMLEAMSMKYHSSWDWLMPVIQKIYLMDEYDKWIDTLGMFASSIQNSLGSASLLHTYEAVVEFIKWYNQQ